VTTKSMGDFITSFFRRRRDAICGIVLISISWRCVFVPLNNIYPSKVGEQLCRCTSHNCARESNSTGAMSVGFSSDFLRDCSQTLLKTLEDTHMHSQPVKDLLGSAIASLNTGEREDWLRSLNPIIIKDKSYLHEHVRSICNVSNSVALVTIANGVMPNIQEWCLYHLLSGVKQIFIYDDANPEMSTSANFHAALQPFVDTELVVLKDVVMEGGWGRKELTAFDDFLRNHAPSFDWFGVLGSDEYFVIHTTECIPTFLHNFRQHGGFVAMQNMRNMIGVRHHDPFQTHMEQYHCYFHDERGEVKSFVQPQYVKRFVIHHAEYIAGYHAVDAFGQIVDGPFDSANALHSSRYSSAEVRHYWTGDWKFALYEKICGDNQQRKLHKAVRAQSLLRALNDGCNATFDMPPIHSKFKRILYGA